MDVTLQLKVRGCQAGFLRIYMVFLWITSKHKKTERFKGKNHSASMLSHVRLFVTPWTVVHQAPLPTKFSRQEYWCGLPFPPPRDLPHPETEPTTPESSALASRFFTTSTTWKLKGKNGGQYICKLSWKDTADEYQYWINKFEGKRSPETYTGCLYW